MQKFKHGLIAVQLSTHGPNVSVHFAGYPEVPGAQDIKALENELNTDPEFGLVGRIGIDVFVKRASPGACAAYFKLIGQ